MIEEKRPGRASHALLGALPLVALAAAAPPAAAEPLQVGGWFGPRLFSGDSRLGYIAGEPYLGLSSTIAFGPRIGRPLRPWIVPELELGFAPAHTETRTVVDEPTRVFWLDPRLHARFELMPGRRLQPFAVVGGGAPIGLSTRQSRFATSIVGSGYLGGGVRFDSLKGFMIRFDARVALLPGIERAIAAEVDIGFGIELTLGGPGPRPGGERASARGEAGGARPGDRDEDGIPDDRDACPDRAEDADGFDDQDGCPDIDNDLDRVLDLADRCPAAAETYNGIDDDDGCPDTVPADIDSLKGTIEGLIYTEGETKVRAAARPSIAKIAKIMNAHPSIRVVVIGHTDDREAKQFAAGGAGQPKDIAALSADLSRARAEAVRQAIAAQGIAATRIDAEGRGAEDPVSDNDRPRGRLANRRVEIKLYVAPSAQRR